MKSRKQIAPLEAAENSPQILHELEVREVLPEEMERARELLEAEHYLGAGRAVGKRWCR
jgi:hypothetical protein